METVKLHLEELTVNSFLPVNSKPNTGIKEPDFTTLSSIF